MPERSAATRQDARRATDSRAGHGAGPRRRPPGSYAPSCPHSRRGVAKAARGAAPGTVREIASAVWNSRGKLREIHTARRRRREHAGNARSHPQACARAGPAGALAENPGDGCPGGSLAAVFPRFAKDDPIADSSRIIGRRRAIIHRMTHRVAAGALARDDRGTIAGTSGGE